MAKPTGKRGRPPITCDDLIPDWEEVALNGYAIGMSDVEVKKLLASPGCRILGNSTWTKLMDDPIFSETIKRGHELSQAWWEEQGRKGLHNLKFNSGLWYMNMKNRHGWRDKKPDEVSHNFTHTTLSDPSQILDILEKLGKK